MIVTAPQDLPRLATGYTAMALSGYFIVAGEDLSVFLASVFFLFICITDTHRSRIPNLANLALALAGIVVRTAGGGLPGLESSLLGLATGWALLIIPYLMGGMGAGDVKALAALGALLGPDAIFQVFLYTGLIGGVLAIVHYLFNHDLKAKCLQAIRTLHLFCYTHKLGDLKPGRIEKLRFPYAAAIAFGFFAYHHWGALL